MVVPTSNEGVEILPPAQNIRRKHVFLNNTGSENLAISLNKDLNNGVIEKYFILRAGTDLTLNQISNEYNHGFTAKSLGASAGEINVYEV